MAVDDESPLIDADLGELLEAFAPSRANLGAGLLLGGAACVAGAVVIWYPLPAAHAANWDLPWYAKKLAASWFAVGVFGLLGAGVFACGAALLAYCRWLAAHRVDVCAGGFRYAVPHSVATIRWAEVCLIVETVKHDPLPVPLNGLHTLFVLFGPSFVSRSYTASTFGGREYGFDGDTVGRLRRFGQLLREQADAHSVAWVTVELGT